MLSKEDLARIVKDEIENKIREGKEPNELYYILLNGKMYPGDDYDKEVVEGKRSPDDIYAYVNIHTSKDFDTFLFYVSYIFSVEPIVYAYLRKMGFTLKRYVVQHPTPNLKYYIDVNIKRDEYRKPQYLVVSIYDIDALARILHIPQIVEQKLGNQPREITKDELSDIGYTVIDEQPILAGYTYDDAWIILDDYYVYHKKEYKDEAFKITLAYTNLFPTPYEVCYEWKATMFLKIGCLKLERLRFSS